MVVKGGTKIYKNGREHLVITRASRSRQMEMEYNIVDIEHGGVYFVEFVDMLTLRHYIDINKFKEMANAQV